MDRAKLIKMVSERMNIHPRAAKIVRDTVFNEMTESLQKGERIEIRGFGSFAVRQYGAYKGRNPKTGKIVDVPPRSFLTSRLGKNSKRR